MQLITEKAKEKELPNNYHFVECQKSSFIYWFENGSQVRNIYRPKDFTYQAHHPPFFGHFPCKKSD
jgi:hypothetical protein